MRNEVTSRAIFVTVVALLATIAIMPIAQPVVAQTEQQPPGGYWTQRASMTTARDHPGVVGVNGKVYVFGGSNASGALDSVEIYDPATDTWTPGPSMPGAKGAPSAVAIDGLIYVLAGNKFVYRFDPSQGTWSIKSPVPVSFTGPAAVAVFDRKIYLACDEQWMYCYDPAADNWTAKTPVPVKRSIASFAALSGKLYAIGGGEPGHVPSEIDRIDVYAPVNDSWTIGGAASLHTRRTHLGSPMPVVNGKIYVIGGWNGYSALTSMEEYDPTTDGWRDVTSMPVARYAIGYGVLDNKIYAIGGNYGGAGGHWQTRNDEFTVRVLAEEMPSPEISFRADQTNITVGECTTLRWDVEHVQAVYLDGERVVGHGTRQVCPTQTTEYTLRVETERDTVERRIAVAVVAQQVAHALVEMGDQDGDGQAVMCTPSDCFGRIRRIVQWLQQRPEECYLEPPCHYSCDPYTIMWLPGQDNIASNLQPGEIVEVYGYCWLDFLGPVIDIPRGEPYYLRRIQDSEPGPEPEISFRADRTNIEAGECTTLRWDVEHVKAVYLDGEGVAGHDTRQVCPAQTTKYTLRVVTADGDVYRTVTITVTPACTPGSKCKDTSHKAYQNADCSWKSVTYCEHGCQNGECKMPLPSGFHLHNPPDEEIFLLSPQSSLGNHPFIPLRAHCERCEGGEIRAEVRIVHPFDIGLSDSLSTHKVVLTHQGDGDYKLDLRLPDYMPDKLGLAAILGDYTVKLTEFVDQSGQSMPIKDTAKTTTRFTIALDLDNNQAADDTRIAKVWYGIYDVAYKDPLWSCLFSLVRTATGMGPSLSILKMIAEVSSGQIEDGVMTWLVTMAKEVTDLPWACIVNFLSFIVPETTEYPFTPAPPDVAQELAHRYAPTLYMDANESYSPHSMNIMLKNSALITEDNEEVIARTLVTSATFDKYNGSNYWLDLLPDLAQIPVYQDFCYEPMQEYVRLYHDAQEQGNFSDLSYARVLEGSDWVVIQYWFFYLFNDWCNKHEGDWEGVDIIFNGVSSAREILDNPSIAPQFVAYSQHGAGQRVRWENVIRENMHSRIYVAVGSHANYASPGYYPAVIGIDRAEPDFNKPALNPTIELIAQSGDGRLLPESAWANFVGEWGESAWLGVSSAPRLATSSRWLNPYGLAMDLPEVDPFEEKRTLWAFVGSPVELHVYDSAGRHLGPNLSGGVDLQIPGAEYTADPETGHSLAKIPSADPTEGYRVVLRGTDDGTAQLVVGYPEIQQKTQQVIEFSDIAVAPELQAQFTVPVESQAELSLQIDADGDGAFEQRQEPDKRHEVSLEPTQHEEQLPPSTPPPLPCSTGMLTVLTAAVAVMTSRRFGLR